MAFAPPPSRPHFPSGEKVQGMTNMVVKHFRNVCQWISELYPYQTQDARAKERSQGDKSQECRYAWAAVCRASGILGHCTPLCWSGTFLCCQPQSPHWNLHKKFSTKLCMYILDLALTEIEITPIARSEMLSKRSIQSSFCWVSYTLSHGFMRYVVTQEKPVENVRQFLTQLLYISDDVTNTTNVSTKVVLQKRKSVRDNAEWYYGY